MNTPVQLVFFGEILQGFQRDDVQRQLGQLLKLDETRQAQLFSGARRVLKRSVPRAEADRYVEHLARLGARLHVEPDGQEAAPPLPAAAAPTHAAVLQTPAVAPLAEAASPAAATAPVAEEEIVCPCCGERQSKRILCRACATNMPMGIAAKEEAEREAREARRAEWRARRGLAPEGGGSAAQNEESPSMWGVGFEGRMGRLRYATAGLVLTTPLMLLTYFLLQSVTGPRLVLFGVGLLAMLFFAMRVAVLRLHDFNRSGWWSLVLMAPYIGTVASFVILLLPGTDGSNPHGEPPRRGSWWQLAAAAVAFCLALGLALEGLVALYSEDDLTQYDPREQATSSAALQVAQLPSADARAAFESQYLPAANHKVFAVSSHGGWGWAGGKVSLQDAALAALSDCDARRPPYTPECRPVNVNGQWVRQESD